MRKFQEFMEEQKKNESIMGGPDMDPAYPTKAKLDAIMQYLPHAAPQVVDQVYAILRQYM